MFEEISMMLYGYIVQAEMIFLDIYKVNPFDIIGKMPLVDLQLYMKRIEEDQKKKHDNFKKKDFIEALKRVNELLTWCFHRK